MHLLYLQDAAGDENWHVHAVNIATGEDRDITPYDGCRAEALHTSKADPNTILVGINNRDKSVFDMHRYPEEIV